MWTDKQRLLSSDMCTQLGCSSGTTCIMHHFSTFRVRAPFLCTHWHPSTSRPFHSCPHFISLCPLLLENDLFHYPCTLTLGTTCPGSGSALHSPAQAASWAGRAGCCVISQPVCQPSVSAMTQSKSATTEKLWWGSVRKELTLYIIFSHTPSHPRNPPSMKP